MNPENRVVILTGATQGIGRATAYTLAGAGCKLALVARSVEPLQALADELGPQAVAVPADMGHTTQAAKVAQETAKIFGRIDVVINNVKEG